MMRLRLGKNLWVEGAIALTLLVSMQPGNREQAIAQEVEGCFMVTSSGQSLTLDGVCDGTSFPRSTPQTPGVFRAEIKRRLGGTPVIGVTFNDGQSFDMILDTGASVTLITQEMAEALQVERVDSVTSTIADGSRVTFDVGYVQSIAVNGATATNIPVAIAPEMDIGLLGNNFFSQYDVQIKENVVEFRPRSGS